MALSAERSTLFRRPRRLRAGSDRAPRPCSRWQHRCRRVASVRHVPAPRSRSTKLNACPSVRHGHQRQRRLPARGETRETSRRVTTPRVPSEPMNEIDEVHVAAARDTRLISFARSAWRRPAPDTIALRRTSSRSLFSLVARAAAARELEDRAIRQDDGHADTHSACLPYLKVAAPAALVATMPPAKLR